MTFLTLLALVMLTLVGYSTGAALAQRARHPQPRLLDLLLLPVLWALALTFRNVLGHWSSIAVWFVVALVVSAAIGRSRPAGEPQGRLAPLPAHPNPLRGLWERWKRFSRELGQFQGRILMSFFYFLVVTPFGVGAHFFTDPLHVRQSASHSAWKARETMEDSLDQARKQS